MAEISMSIGAFVAGINDVAGQSADDAWHVILLAREIREFVSDAEETAETKSLLDSAMRAERFALRWLTAQRITLPANISVPGSTPADATTYVRPGTAG